MNLLEQIDIRLAAQRFRAHYLANTVATPSGACRAVADELDLPLTPAVRDQLMRLFHNLAGRDDGALDYDDVVAQSFPASDPPPLASHARH